MYVPLTVLGQEDKRIIGTDGVLFLDEAGEAFKTMSNEAKKEIIFRAVIYIRVLN